MSIWEILGIEATDKIDVIRAAYSEKVKEFHPEDDPEGFMRLRNAYKSAVQSVSHRSVYSLPVTAPLHSPQKPDLGEKKNFEPDKSSEPQFLDNRDKKPEIVECAPTSEQPVYDFSKLRDLDTAPVEPEPPSFDFSMLEETAIAHSEKEKQNSDELIALARMIYNTRSRRRSVSEWKAFFLRYDLKMSMRSEYFTWAFLDFLAMSIEIPEKVRTALLIPFVNEWRGYWSGTVLWDEFFVINQKYVSKGLVRAKKTIRLQLAAIAAPVLVFIAAAIISGLVIQQDYNSAEGVLTYKYWSEITLVIALAASAICSAAIQLLCFNSVRKKVNRGVSGQWKRSTSGLIMVMVAVPTLIICVLLMNHRFDEMSKYRSDLAQIKEKRLTEAVVYIYKDIKGNTIHVVSTDSSPNNIYTYFSIPRWVQFEPAPTDLLDDHHSRQTNLENGMKAYRITYTDMTKVLVTIEEVIYKK